MKDKEKKALLLGIAGLVIAVLLIFFSYSGYSLFSQDENSIPTEAEDTGVDAGILPEPEIKEQEAEPDASEPKESQEVPENDSMEDQHEEKTRLCGNGILDEGEFCDDGNTKGLDGCSWSCKVEGRNTVYVASYMGNIDGDFSPDWFYMYDILTRFHDENEIPSGFSIYPESMHGEEFGKSFKKMHESDYVEFVQKGNSGSEKEHIMESLSYEEVEEIILAGRENFLSAAREALGNDDVEVPVAYNQPQGRFSVTMRNVLEDLGFHIFYEMYKNDELDAVESTEDFDVLQYGIGFTKYGEAGRESEFRHPDLMVSDIKKFRRTDVNILKINSNKIVPIWCHQSDFEHKTEDNKLDQDKWEIYKRTMRNLKADPDIIFVGPSMIYELRHPAQ